MKTKMHCHIGIDVIEILNSCVFNPKYNAMAEEIKFLAEEPNMRYYTYIVV